VGAYVIGVAVNDDYVDSEWNAGNNTHVHPAEVLHVAGGNEQLSTSKANRLDSAVNGKQLQLLAREVPAKTAATTTTTMTMTLKPYSGLLRGSHGCEGCQLTE
jgi:hypothetical protein